MAQDYNILKREAFWQKFWDKEKIYQFQKTAKKPIFSIDTPPPYISAEHLHLGHVMSYSQADFIARFKRMQGFNVFYPMGFDDNGLPTERYVEKKYKIDKTKIDPKKFIELCKKESDLGIKSYKKLWKLIALSVDFTKTYRTIGEFCQKIAQWSFIDLFKKGKIERREEAILWCPECQTAISQADVEDREEVGFLHYIILESNGKKITISTTRPEFLPACQAILYHPEDKRSNWLKGKKAKIPIFNFEVPILPSKRVKKDFGSGLEMVCSFGSSQDVEIIREMKLGVKIILQKDGRLNENAGILAGLKINEAREKILTLLKREGLLEKSEKIFHTLPCHERCQTPVEFLKGWQWFIKIVDQKNRLLELGFKIKWFPKEAHKIYQIWTKSLKWDWCISRQRYYGVPFPVWYCKNCQEAVLPKIKDLPVDPRFEKPPFKKCPKCGSLEFLPEKDVMDTWMTSSLTPLIVAKLSGKSFKKIFPISLRPQAFEIIRTWLFYSVLKSYFHFNLLPFKAVMISGHGLDSQGRKFSKRLGNYFPPETLIQKYGSDAVRYWAAKANLGENLRYSEKEIERGKRTVIKLLNAGRFCFIHFKSKNYSKFSSKNLLPEDRWIIDKFNKTLRLATSYFEEYQISKAKIAVEDFFWNDFCSNYLEFVKSRLYQKKEDLASKRVLYQVFLGILKLYAPFLPHVCEELYQKYFRKFERKKSIHLLSWPKPIKIHLEKEEIKDFERALSVIFEIRKFKSNLKLSQGAKIDVFETKIPLSEKLREFVKRVMNVGELIAK